METAVLHRWHELNHEGDTTVEWDPNDAASTDIARKTFEAMKAAGCHFFEKKHGGGAGRRIDRFDPEIERMVMVKQIVAG